MRVWLVGADFKEKSGNGPLEQNRWKFNRVSYSIDETGFLIFGFHENAETSKVYQRFLGLPMQNNFWKNCLLIFVCTVGIGGIVGSLLPAPGPATPQLFEQLKRVNLETQSVIDLVDQEFESRWQREGLSVAERADDLTIIRRLGLALAGTIPSVEEIREIEKLPESQRIEWWLSRLLEDERTADHLAERLARGLIGVEDGPFLIYRRRRFVSWLSDQFLANRPYDQIVQDLLTEEGVWTGTPATNFVTVTTDMETEQPDPIRLAARTTRAFLGMRIDCVECHDDFLGNIRLGDQGEPRKGVQTDFHKLAAFFGEVENSLAGIRDNVGSSPYQYRLLNDEDETVIDPDVPYLSELVPTDGPLRTRLAGWVTHRENKQFSRAIVNKVWAVLFGKGLVDPVDDMPLHGPFPPGLERLSEDFVENGFDLHRLIYLIARTKAFQLESAAEFEIAAKHEKYYAVFPLIRLRPEQVAGAMIQSTSLSTIDRSKHIVIQLTKFGQTLDFVNRYGDPGEDELLEKGETVTQRLLMLNGDMLKERLQGPMSSVVKIAMLSPDPETMVDTIYLAVLSRRPSKKLRAHFASELAERNGAERGQKVQDIYWTLINSAEFAWNH